eukprot:TRINITY_DN9_c0_g2_i4.p1 TRINITY_DN9_c0_g2~~TRINITY_DN9_c0_g2_i4.p1  ORF type:complete len:166 (+),score=14.37 TRINITY_DN9_c0_g2_i4:621-1118(+)
MQSQPKSGRNYENLCTDTQKVVLHDMWATGDGLIDNARIKKADAFSNIVEYPNRNECLERETGTFGRLQPVQEQYHQVPVKTIEFPISGSNCHMKVKPLRSPNLKRCCQRPVKVSGGSINEMSDIFSLVSENYASAPSKNKTNYENIKKIIKVDQNIHELKPEKI